MVTLAIRFRNQRKKRHPWEIITDPQNGSSYTHKKTLYVTSLVLQFLFSSFLCLDFMVISRMSSQTAPLTLVLLFSCVSPACS